MEILSPAGSMESVYAAVINGTDAVYLGQQDFNARRSAANFDFEALCQAVEFCHARNVKVYQTLNTLVFDDQLDRLKTNIQNACRAGIDAFIIQDIGVLEIVKSCCNIPVHASTQMTVHTLKGAQAAQKLGFSRVVLARELSYEEINEITDNTDIETEVFVHGALCMSVSGQCYMSAMIGSRSANRGGCAGSCRLPMTFDKKSCSHCLSLKDLSLINHLDKLEQAGVTSLKIEGRMKRPEYVAAAAACYSAAKQNRPYDAELLKKIFSRSGFTDGYFLNKRSNDMFGIRDKADVLSADSQTLKQLKNTYHKDKQTIGISMSFTAKHGMPARLTISDGDSNTVSVNGPIPDKAVNRPVTEQSVTASLSKLGSTIFYPENINIDIDNDIILPMSVLNEMRRSACEQLYNKRAIRVCYEFHPDKFNSAVTFNKPELISRHNTFENTHIILRYPNAELINHTDAKQAYMIILPSDEILNNLGALLKYKDKIIAEPDRVMFSYEQQTINQLKTLAEHGFNKIYASNIAHLEIAKELGLEIWGDAFLNCTNSTSLNYFENYGLKALTLSPELTFSKIKHLKVSNNIKVGIFAYGYFPVMITRNCPAKLKSGNNCSVCKGTNTMTDKSGHKFHVTCNKKRYSLVLNGTPIVLSDKDTRFCDYTVLYFTKESKNECSQIISQYINKLPPQGEFTRGLYQRGVE